MKSVVAGSKPASFATRSAGIDVGDEARRNPGVGVVAQRLVDHHRAQVRAPDADVHHGADPFSGGAGPFAIAQPVGEVTHRVEHLVDVRHDVLAVDDQFGVSGQPQRGVQHRAVLRGVDVRPGEHRVAVLFEVGRPGQVDQQLQRLAADAVFAVVDVQVTDVEGEFPAAIGIVVEELAQVGFADLIVMPAQSAPRRGRGDVRGGLHGGHGSTLVRCGAAEPPVVGGGITPTRQIHSGQWPSRPRPNRNSSIARSLPSGPSSL